MTLSRVRVAAGYAVFVIALFCARPTTGSILAAIPLALLGQALRLWAAGHIEKTHALATGGPYAHTRNPLYLGSVLLALAAGLAAASPWAIAAIATYFVVFYPAIVAEEAAFLRAKFPHEYAAWASQVPLFLPRVSSGGPRSSRFSWRRVAANREWRTALALPFVFALLWARGRYVP
jgi:protein-S-isoprenylcysteine O-methyltransferase Ste14